MGHKINTYNPMPEVIYHENPGYYKENQISVEEHFEKTGRIYNGKKEKDDSFVIKLDERINKYSNNPQSIYYDNMNNNTNDMIQDYLNNSVNSPLNNFSQCIKGNIKTAGNNRISSAIKNVKQQTIVPENQISIQQTIPNNISVNQNIFNPQQRMIRSAVNNNQINSNKLLINKEKLREKLIQQSDSQNNLNKNKKNSILSENIYKKKKTVKY